MTGHVVHFDERRRFGKIRGDDGQERFVHWTSLVDVTGLSRGQRVVFDHIDTDRGPRAETVRPVEASVT